MDLTNNNVHDIQDMYDNTDEFAIIKNIFDTLTYYKKTTHPNISEVWMNYIENKIYNKNLNAQELVVQYNNMLNIIKNYPDMSLNNILLLSIIKLTF
jgi:hypothetical protein